MNEKMKFVTEKRRRVLALKKVFGTPEGKVALELIKEFSLYGQQAYVPGHPAEHTIFRNGCQQVAINIIELLEYSVEELDDEVKQQNKEKSYEI